MMKESINIQCLYEHAISRFLITIPMNDDDSRIL